MEKFGKQKPDSLEDKFQKLQEKVNLTMEKIELMEKFLGSINSTPKIQKEEEFDFKKGDYVTIKTPDDRSLIAIFSCKAENGIHIIASLNLYNHLNFDCRFGFNDGDSIHLSTPSEIALLDSKLAKQGKKFNKEKCKIVDIPKYKEPIIGEMAIFWDAEKKYANCRIYARTEENVKYRYVDSFGACWCNAILFESPEQYKNFINEK